MLKGLDVSHHNPVSAIPWPGHDFAIVRITWGVEGIDGLAVEHLRRAQKAGCELVAYHYLKDQDGDAQCDHFLRRAAELEQTFGPLAHMVDLEDMPAPHPPWDLVTYQRAVAAFIGRHRERCRRPTLVYGNPKDLARYAVAPRIAECPLMVAHWGVATPKVPAPWTGWTIHQYAVTDGVYRNVFRGTREDWRALLLPDVGGGSYDVLGPAVTATRAAMGIGDSVEDFRTTDEGP